MSLESDVLDLKRRVVWLEGRTFWILWGWVGSSVGLLILIGILAKMVLILGGFS